MSGILITGGTGFFGKSMLDYRLRHPAFARDYGFTILSRDPEAFRSANPVLAKQSNVQWVKGDVRDFDFHAAAGNYAAIFHAATPASTQIVDSEMTSIIVEGTRRVIEFARAMDCRRVLFTSSGAVYGPQNAAVDETAECNPATAYGKGKLAAERMLVESGLEVKIARCFAFVGPHLNRDIHYAIGNFIRDVLAQRPIVIRGDGTPFRSYLYADDLVEWLFAILERGVTGRPYNVGSERALPIRDLAAVVREALGGANEINVLGVPGDGAPSVYAPITARARLELGVREKVDLREAIRLSAVAN